MNDAFWEGFQKEASAATETAKNVPTGWGKTLQDVVATTGDGVEKIIKGIGTQAMKTPKTALIAGLAAGGGGVHAYHKITKPSVVYG